MSMLSEPVPVGQPGHEVFRTAMITGHRPQLLTAEHLAWSQLSIANVVWRLRSMYGTVNAISGMALGADTWWALSALASGMHLHSYVPFEEQADSWSIADREMWRLLRGKAVHEVVVGSRGYNVGDLHGRNDAMLDATATARGLVVALYLDGQPGGTASMVKKARAKGVPMLILDPEARTVRRDGW